MGLLALGVMYGGVSWAVIVAGFRPSSLTWPPTSAPCRSACARAARLADSALSVEPDTLTDRMSAPVSPRCHPAVTPVLRQAADLRVDVDLNTSDQARSRCRTHAGRRRSPQVSDVDPVAACDLRTPSFVGRHLHKRESAWHHTASGRRPAPPTARTTSTALAPASPGSVTTAVLSHRTPSKLDALSARLASRPTSSVSSTKRQRSLLSSAKVSPCSCMAPPDPGAASHESRGRARRLPPPSGMRVPPAWSCSSPPRGATQAASRRRPALSSTNRRCGTVAAGPQPSPVGQTSGRARGSHGR